MKKCIIYLIIVLLLNLISINVVFADSNSVIDSWNPIKIMHISKDYNEISDLHEDDIYEFTNNKIINQSKLNVIVYIDGIEKYNTSGSIELNDGYYYVAREYNSLDKKIYLLSALSENRLSDWLTTSLPKGTFIYQYDTVDYEVICEDVTYYVGQIVGSTDFKVFYYPFKYNVAGMHSSESTNSYIELQEQDDMYLYMNGQEYAFNAYALSINNDNPFSEYFDISFDFTKNEYIFNVKKSFSTELGEVGGWLACGNNYDDFIKYNVKIIGNGTITINQSNPGPLEEYSFSSNVVSIVGKFTIGDENSNIEFICNDLIDKQTKNDEYDRTGNFYITNGINAGSVEINNSKFISNVDQSSIIASDRVMVTNGSEITINADDTYDENELINSSGIACYFGNIYFKDSTLSILNADLGVICSVPDSNITFDNSNVNINTNINCLYISEPINIVGDNPYVSISLNSKKPNGKIFDWDREYYLIDNPINDNSLPKYMKYIIKTNTDGSTSVLFYGPNFIFYNVDGKVDYLFDVDTGILSIANPKKNSYEFDGWYLDSELKNKWNNNTVVENPYDFALYARWKEKHQDAKKDVFYRIPKTGVE